MKACRRTAYASFPAALAAAKDGNRYAESKGVPSPRLRPYRCPDCNQLHVAAAAQAISRGARR